MELFHNFSVATMSEATLTAPTPTAVRRLTRDLKKLKDEPIEGIDALPLDDNILEWHYIIHGSKDTPYAGGIYHGRLVFAFDFPWKPPSIYMSTPSGRFQPDVRLCLSISDYHPESWNPGWTVSAILVGLHSFMNENQHATGCVSSTDQAKKDLAKKSKAFNLRNEKFRKLFPGLAEQIEKEGIEEAAAKKAARDRRPPAGKAAIPPKRAHNDAEDQAEGPAPVLVPPPVVVPAPVVPPKKGRQAAKKTEQAKPAEPEEKDVPADPPAPRQSRRLAAKK